MNDGFYWARVRGHADQLFVALYEGGQWYGPGIDHPIDIDDDDVVASVPLPDKLQMSLTVH